MSPKCVTLAYFLGLKCVRMQINALKRDFGISVCLSETTEKTIK